MAATQTGAVELLLVEDNFGDALLAGEAFSAARTPVHLTVAVDGEEALSRLRREAPFQDARLPNLVLLDLNLPRMDGHCVLSGIKSDPRLRAIPVIILTGSDSPVDISDSYALGASGYIVKPAYFEQLEAVVAAIEAFWFDIARLPRTTPGGHGDAT